jgi:hypothetical protein
MVSVHTVWTTFSTLEDGKLVEYITTGNHIDYGLRKKKAMKPLNGFQRK